MSLVELTGFGGFEEITAIGLRGCAFYIVFFKLFEATEVKKFPLYSLFLEFYLICWLIGWRFLALLASSEPAVKLGS